jgi:hypothetical protein
MVRDPQTHQAWACRTLPYISRLTASGTTSNSCRGRLAGRRAGPALAAGTPCDGGDATADADAAAGCAGTLRCAATGAGLDSFRGRFGWGCDCAASATTGCFAGWGSAEGDEGRLAGSLVFEGECLEPPLAAAEPPGAMDDGGDATAAAAAAAGGGARASA